MISKPLNRKNSSKTSQLIFPQSKFRVKFTEPKPLWRYPADFLMKCFWKNFLENNYRFPASRFPRERVGIISTALVLTSFANNKVYGGNWRKLSILFASLGRSKRFFKSQNLKHREWKIIQINFSLLDFHCKKWQKKKRVMNLLIRKIIE